MSRRRGSLSLLFVLAMQSFAVAQPLPEDDIQVDLHTYFDSFGVNVLYPSVSGSKQISASTSVSGRYLVDVISAASMRSHFEVDGVTSATQKLEGGGSGGPDEVRHEFGIGLNQRLGPGLGSVTVLRSSEHDYSSTTLLGTASRPLADQNAEIQVGLAHSWDRVSPVTRDWNRPKNVTTLDLNLTQTLSRRSVAQFNYSYIRMTGQLTDVYEVVTIVYPDDHLSVGYEPRHPDQRARNALGASVNFKTSAQSSLRIGYRHYWDSWSVDSDTVQGLYQHRISDSGVTIGLGLRAYFQGRAEFFKPSYSQPEPLMAVDGRLDSGNSLEYQLRVTMPGTLVRGLGLFDGTATDLNARINLYQRSTSTADWHSRRTDMNALLMSLGFRFRY